MCKLRNLLKHYLRDFLILFRHRKNLTQEQLAALLHISARSYSDLECGKYRFSAATLILFLALLPDEEILHIIRGFLPVVAESEKKEAA